MIIPFYIALSAEEFTTLNAADVDERFNAIKGAIETSLRPVIDIDVAFSDTADALAEALDPSTASGIIFGTRDWDDKGLTDGMRLNAPGQVADYAAALESLDPDEFEVADVIDILTVFYAEARNRGDAIVVYFN